MSGTPSKDIIAERLDGQTALVQAVRLEFDREEGLALVRLDAPDASVEVWPWTAVNVTGVLQETHLSHAVTQGLRLVVRDVAVRDALRARGVHVPSDKFSRRVGVAVGLLALVVTAGVAIALSVPRLSRWIAHRIPPSMEAHLAGSVDDALAKMTCDGEEGQAALADLLTRLGAGSDGAKVSVVNLSLVNAFALPGQRVVLTRGLLEEVESPDEVAAVLAHELEHVHQRHVLAHVVRSSLLSAAWAVTVGDFAGLMVLDPTTAFEIATLRFNRDDEREADTGALKRLEGASIDRHAFARFFERLQKEGGEVPTLLSTHPPHAERVAAGPPERAANAKPALSPDQWEALRATCAKSPPPKLSWEDFL
ncbi:MAG: M48 family metallopeptidase [Myxococcaceae bacterium]